jgi:hypothetical protein
MATELELRLTQEAQETQQRWHQRLAAEVSCGRGRPTDPPRNWDFTVNNRDLMRFIVGFIEI